MIVDLIAQFIEYRQVMVPLITGYFFEMMLLVAAVFAAGSLVGFPVVELFLKQNRHTIGSPVLTVFGPPGRGQKPGMGMTAPPTHRSPRGVSALLQKEPQTFARYG
ncbi:MAG: hypothetical protein KDL31_10060 [Kiritimatiellae bacterium]|nr:hypothetical protein [Kiritimatiellia bacterium]